MHTWITSGISQAGMHVSLAHLGIGSCHRRQAFRLHGKLDVMTVFLTTIYFRVNGVICFSSLFQPLCLFDVGFYSLRKLCLFCFFQHYKATSQGQLETDAKCQRCQVKPGTVGPLYLVESCRGFLSGKIGGAFFPGGPPLLESLVLRLPIFHVIPLPNMAISLL